MIYSTNGGPQEWPEDDAHDPDSEVEYAIYWGLPIRRDSTSYKKGVDTVLPSVSNGCMYECVSGGITDAAEPYMETREGKKFDDGDVKWKTLPQNARMGHGDIISTSEWESDIGVVISATSIVDDIYTRARITSVPIDLTSFTLTNTATILYANGDTEKRVKSLIIPIKEL